MCGIAGFLELERRPGTQELDACPFDQLLLAQRHERSSGSVDVRDGSV